MWPKFGILFSLATSFKFFLDHSAQCKGPFIEQSPSESYWPVRAFTEVNAVHPLNLKLSSNNISYHYATTTQSLAYTYTIYNLQAITFQSVTAPKQPITNKHQHYNQYLRYASNNFSVLWLIRNFITINTLHPHNL